MSRAINFSPGPAMLPDAVLQQAAAEMFDWRGSGQSVMEMSHRGKEFLSIAEDAEKRLRSVMGIPAGYKVLFVQGGASTQFAMVPMNLLRGGAADYVHTGEWAKKAIEEAKLIGQANIAASSKDANFSYIPPQASWKLNPAAPYVHITSNETIGGTQFHWTPDTGSVPLVADMSSDILSRPMDVSRYGAIYAGAQKNMGTAGLTIVIIREDLVGHAPAGTPHMMDYKTHVETGSGYNTPPTWSIYISGLVLEWIEKQGGLAAMETRHREKASLLYSILDSSGLYRGPARKEDRSLMNVTFTLTRPELEEAFLKGAKHEGMIQLKGHRSVGGFRASIYNAMPVESVRVLADYMRAFEKQNG